MLEIQWAVTMCCLNSFKEQDTIGIYFMNEKKKVYISDHFMKRRKSTDLLIPFEEEK